MNRRKIILTVLVLVLVAVGTFFAVRQAATPSSTSNMQVSASYYPLYDFARNIGGSKVQVTNLTPDGAEPHDYEPSPKTLITIQQSDVFVYNGGAMEPWVNTFLNDYTHHKVKASTGIPLHKDKDPHFWLDPIYAQQIVKNILDGLIAADPANKGYYSKNAAAYIGKLTTLGQDFKHGLSACKQDTVISSHDAFSYVADRYNFKIESISGVDPEQEPSAARLAEISQIVNQKQLDYIFFESLVSPRLADTIAQETGAKTLVFEPIEGLSNEDQKQGKDYISVQRENLRNLRTALACQ
jgi:zinc transport system substrate-binding protein